MGEACSTYGGRGESYTGFWWGDLVEIDHLKDRLKLRVILKRIFKKW